MPRHTPLVIVVLLASFGCSQGTDREPPPPPSTRGHSLATIKESPRAKEAMQASRKLMNEGLFGKSPNAELNAMSEYNSWSLLNWELVGESEVWFSGSLWENLGAVSLNS